MNKINSTKRALVASVLMLCLCFTMLIGTTFAWFTDTVTSANNVIKSGTLDVEMYWAKGTEDPAGATWIDASKGAIFNNTRWEPGYAEARHLKIENVGTLALNYRLAIIPHGEVSELADVIDVYLVKGATQVDERTDLDAYRVGTLRELINTGISKGTLAEDGIFDATIVLKMRKTAGNDYQDLSIGSDFSIQLIATQVAAEKDSFDETYDEDAFFTVGSVAELREAIANAVDTATIFVQPGTYEVGSVIQIEGKSITIAGLGVVNFKMTGKDHMFRIQDCKDPENKMVATVKNINIDGNGISKHAFNVKYNVTANIENVIIKNTGWSGIVLDNANPYEDNQFYNGVTTVVNLKNTQVDEVSMDTLPVASTHVYHPDNPAAYPKAPVDYKTYAYLNYDEESSVQILEKQSISTNPATMYVNGNNSDPIGYTFLVDSSEELTAVLDAVHTNSKYWNKPLNVKLAAGEYDGDYTINQYPQWNGEWGHGNTANPYNAGVAGAPVLNLTISGATANAFAMRAVAVPAAVFTGKITVNGFGNSMAGFTTTDDNPAPITFKNVGFNGENITPDGSNVIQVAITKAADNVSFDGCYFTNATHITIGESKFRNIDTIAFTDCTFVNGGCLSGYPKELTVNGGSVDGADNGFLNIQNACDVVVNDVTVRAGAYYFRTGRNSTGVNLTVNGGSIELYKDPKDGTDYLVHFRGSNESATFTDVTLPVNYTTEGVDADSTIESYDFYDVDGVTYVENEITGVNTLYDVPAEYEGDTVTIPEGVEAIRGGAFAGSSVTTVVIPESITDFGATGVTATAAYGGAFKDSAVEKIVLSDGTTEIPAAAFNGAKNLKEVVIPATVETIGVNAFRSTAIEVLTIPATVKTIAHGAFRDMDSLTTVIVEGDLHIPNYAFRNCDNLREVYLKGADTTIGTNTVFCNGDSNNPNTSNITFYVRNEVIKERVLTAMGAERNNTTVICTDPAPDENGVITDANGNSYAYADDTAELNSAIAGGADSVILGGGSFDMPTTTDEVTISGTKDTVIKVYKPQAGKVTLKGVTVQGSGDYTGIQHSDTVIYEDCTVVGVQFLYANTVIFRNCTVDLTATPSYIWTYDAKNVLFENCVFNTAGKAILIYHEGVNSVYNVTVKGCTFNATASALASGAVAAAIEIDSSLSTGGKYTLTTEGNTVDPDFSGEWRVKKSGTNNTVVNGVVYNKTADGLYKGETATYYVYNGNGLKAFNDLMVNRTAGRAVVLNLLCDIDFAGNVWVTADSHVDWGCYISEINGNGYTVKNLTINGQAMFSRFAGSGDVVIKNITFDGANVDSNGKLNTSILTVQTYQNTLLDNVDVKNSTIKGSYKVAPLIGSIYNENSAIHTVIKNCDVYNTTVTGSLDFMITGMVAFVYESDNDTVEFENCTITDVTIITGSKGYDADAAVYCNDGSAAGSFDEAVGVTVTNVTFQ